MTDDAEPSKSLFEYLWEAGQEAAQNPPPPPTEPTHPFDPRAFDEAYAKLVPPRQYRPASEFMHEPDKERRADALYQAWLVEDIDLLCPAIRAMIDEVKTTFSGHLINGVANPVIVPARPKMSARKRPKIKRAKRGSLFD